METSHRVVAAGPTWPYYHSPLRSWASCFDWSGECQLPSQCVLSFDLVLRALIARPHPE
jgi:hypothetical protein